MSTPQIHRTQKNCLKYFSCERKTFRPQCTFSRCVPYGGVIFFVPARARTPRLKCRQQGDGYSSAGRQSTANATAGAASRSHLLSYRCTGPRGWPRPHTCTPPPASSPWAVRKEAGDRPVAPSPAHLHSRRRQARAPRLSCHVVSIFGERRNFVFPRGYYLDVGLDCAGWLVGGSVPAHAGWLPFLIDAAASRGPRFFVVPRILEVRIRVPWKSCNLNCHSKKVPNGDPWKNFPDIRNRMHLDFIFSLGNSKNVRSIPNFLV